MIIGCQMGQRARLGPDQTLEVFYKNLCTGEFDRAASFCNAESMRVYLNGFRSAWEQGDSTVRKIASEMLTEISIEITGKEQDSQNRTLFYTLAINGGQSKEKLAILKKEEGEWKILEITDRH